MSSVGIHALYLTTSTLMIPCKVSDKTYTFCLRAEREQMRHLAQKAPDSFLLEKTLGWGTEGHLPQ